MKVSFVVEGEPKAKARHRTNKTGHTYTPDTTVNYENWVKLSYRIANKDKHLEGEIRASIHAYFTIPKSAVKGKRLAMKHNTVRPTKRPDVDNLAKSILDALNGIAYKDDSQVVDLVVQKFWSEEPRVEVVLEEIELGESK